MSKIAKTPTNECDIPINICPPTNRNLLVKVLAEKTEVALDRNVITPII